MMTVRQLEKLIMPLCSLHSNYLHISRPPSPKHPKAHKLRFVSTSSNLGPRIHWRGEQSCFSERDSLPCASRGPCPHISMGWLSLLEGLVASCKIQRLEEREFARTMSQDIF
jgi:hypothetical protein